MIRFAATWMAVTQAALVAHQLLLLPMQVMLWGMEGTAQWNAALAVATLLLAADLGLKAFGHSSIGPNNQAGGEAESFTSVWAVLRLLIAGFTLLALALTWAVHLWDDGLAPRWLGWLILAAAAECMLIARGMYMDSVGLMARAEGCYALLLCVRLAVASFALLVFQAPPDALAIIYALCGLGSLAAQSLAVRSHPQLALTAGGFRSIAPRTFRLLKYSPAYPVAYWCRFSLPVLVLSAAAPAAMVNAYVALRAVFGFGRAAIQHASRYASVQYALAVASPAGLRRHHLRFWCVACVVLGTAFALGVVLDGGYLLSKWVPGTSSSGYEWLSLTFALGAPFFANHLMIMVCMRTGGEARAARLQVVYAGLALAAAAAGLLSGSMAVYLWAWLLCELAYTAVVVRATRDQGLTRPFIAWTAAGVAVVLGCYGALRWVPGLRGVELPELGARAAVYVVLLALLFVGLRSSVRLSPGSGGTE